MIAFKINNEFVELAPDAGIELQRSNPFIGDDVEGEFSLPVSIRYSDKNYRILNYSGNFYKKHAKYSVGADLYENGLFRYSGTLSITQHESDISNLNETKWTGVFTTGVASFLQQVGDVLLQDINYGPDISYPWTGADSADGSNGFWQHIHQARTPNLFPYVFYPIKNKGYDEDLKVTWCNKLSPSNKFEVAVVDQGSGVFIYGNPSGICPAIYLSFILQKIFAHFGWKLEGDLLSDTQFQKITLPSLRGIDWLNFFSRPLKLFTNRNPVVWNLQDFVPRDISVSAFLVGLRNRFGWGMDFNSTTKTAVFKTNKQRAKSAVKDWTRFVNKSYSSQYTDQSKTYALVNNIGSEDTYPVIMSVPNEYNTVLKKSDLPSPDESTMDKFTLILTLNAFYQGAMDETGYIWKFYSDNIGDYRPANATDEITSDIATMAMSEQVTHGSVTALVPTCNIKGSLPKSVPSTWGCRMLFYHGFRNDSAGVGYPFASPHNFDQGGADLGGNWVMPFEGYGVKAAAAYWWHDWLTFLQVQDTRTFVLSLPVTELKKFNWVDLIFINNVVFMVTQVTEKLPYSGLVNMKMKAIY